jgi:hypothetical protein
MKVRTNDAGADCHDRLQLLQISEGYVLQLEFLCT